MRALVTPGALLLGVVSMALVSGAAEPPLPKLTPDPYPIPLGIDTGRGIDWNQPGEEVAATIAATKTKLVRVLLRIRKPGDTAWYHQYFAALRARGIHVYATVSTEIVPLADPQSFAIAAGPAFKDDSPVPTFGAWSATYVSEAARVIAEFATEVDCFESFNEPNNWLQIRSYQFDSHSFRLPDGEPPQGALPDQREIEALAAEYVPKTDPRKGPETIAVTIQHPYFPGVDVVLRYKRAHDPRYKTACVSAGNLGLLWAALYNEVKVVRKLQVTLASSPLMQDDGASETVTQDANRYFADALAAAVATPGSGNWPNGVPFDEIAIHTYFGHRDTVPGTPKGKKATADEVRKFAVGEVRTSLEGLEAAVKKYSHGLLPIDVSECGAPGNDEKQVSDLATMLQEFADLKAQGQAPIARVIVFNFTNFTGATYGLFTPQGKPADRAGELFLEYAPTSPESVYGGPPRTRGIIRNIPE